ncbi:MAG: Barrel-sandwich domain of CusB or HlyD membrane-fusion [Candidatus Methanoperedenaceae archaeon GB37]|nr:MAG: Barrel-sandwich domain of CusB or HlyD membrane-fusion [Candidatus Methanoperedenaceae archaeon GB37]CAD7777317.1 Barrel-sandwich domain of CusB or HlyD membrane-fusion [Candidatus Methanoperedenaceae archaeon GB37]
MTIPFTAPISGVITARYVDEGAMMDIKKPIVRITDDSIVKVNVAINEKDLPYVKIGQIAYIKVDAYPDKVFKGEVKVINPRIDPATRTALIEIHIQNPKRLLKAGMFAHVNLILG